MSHIDNQLPTEARAKRFIFLMLEKHSAYTDDYRPEDIPTEHVTVHTVNALLDRLPPEQWMGAVDLRGSSQVMMQNTDKGPCLSVRWVEYGPESAEVITPVTGERCYVTHLRKSLEEANTLPNDMPGAILSTGDMLLGDSIYMLNGGEYCYFIDLFEHVKVSELVYELEDVVHGHIDYMLGEEPRSPIFQIRAHAKLMGRDNGPAYEFLEALESIAKRAYEEDE